MGVSIRVDKPILARTTTQSDLDNMSWMIAVLSYLIIF